MVYFIKLSEETKGAAAVLQARSAIRHYNLLKFPDRCSPTDSPQIAMIVDSVERLWRKPVTKKLPTTVDIVKKIIKKQLGLDYLNTKGNFKRSITDWRVAIKTIFKFATFARFEEAVELKKSSFEFLETGDLKVNFLKGKNYNCHDAKSCIIAKLDSEFCPVRLLKKYFEWLDYPRGVDGVFLPAVRSKLVKTAGAKRNFRIQVAIPHHAISYDTCRNVFLALLAKNLNFMENTVIAQEDFLLQEMLTFLG